MSVYVDALRATPPEFHRGRPVFRAMCHMVADSEAELLEMADRIGLRRTWLQRDRHARQYFDLTQNRRRLAVSFGAREVSSRGVVRKLRETGKGEA